MQNPPQELSRQELWRGKEQMKTQSAEKSKGETEKKKRDLTRLVVFIVEKQTNIIQQVNYSVNSTNFFFPQLL